MRVWRIGRLLRRRRAHERTPHERVGFPLRDYVTAATVGGCLSLTLSRWGPTPRRCLGSSGRRAVERTCIPCGTTSHAARHPAAARHPIRQRSPHGLGFPPSLVFRYVTASYLRGQRRTHIHGHGRPRGWGLSRGAPPRPRHAAESIDLCGVPISPPAQSARPWPWTAGYGRPLMGLDYAGFQFFRPCCDA